MAKGAEKIQNIFLIHINSIIKEKHEKATFEAKKILSMML